MQLTLRPLNESVTAATTDQSSSGGNHRNWHNYNAAKVAEKRLFPILLHELCSSVEEPEQERGRPRLGMRDMIFCAALKTYLKTPSRQFSEDMFEASCKRFIKKAPHYNSVSNYQRMDLFTPKVTRLIEISSLPMETIEVDFAVDSTGLSTCRYARWMDERDKQEHARREWIKLHLICGVKSKIVASVIPTHGHEADGPQFGRLLETTWRNFRIGEVYADKAYLSGENMRYAVLAGATPFIPFKSNSSLQADYKSTIWKRMLHTYLYRREEFMAHYNKRNNVETAHRMIKARFDARLSSISRRAQFNEALCKVLCHNLCVLIQSMFELGIDPTFCSESDYDLKSSQARPLGQALNDEELAQVQKHIPAAKKQGIKRGNQSAEGHASQLSLFE